MQNTESLKDFLLLQDLFVDLKLEGWQVTFYDKTGDELRRGFTHPHFRITIKSDDGKKFTVDQIITDTLKRAVGVMSDIGYDYVAHFYGYGGLGRFYIYQDDRDLRSLGQKFTSDWPSLYLIEIGFRSVV